MHSYLNQGAVKQGMFYSALHTGAKDKPKKQFLQVSKTIYRKFTL
jgi:hypothetical protein